jgi:cellulose synthase (UDP-forming)
MNMSVLEPNSPATGALDYLEYWNPTVAQPGTSIMTSGKPGGLVAHRPVESAYGSRYVPDPPSDEERYSYFGPPARWQFLWLFIAQLLIIYSYVNVMAKSPVLWPGLILLTFMAPPTVVNFWLRVCPQRTLLSEHIDKVVQWRLNNVELPEIDIFVPVCGEDDEVINNTCFHISRLEYSRPLNVNVLDDGNLDRTRTVVERYGFNYVVRPNHGEWKKAGNLIHAFDMTKSPFIAVFDADFAPRPDFLYETLPYMDDPVIGVVQTAQYFGIKGVNDMARYAGALQELFFRWVQPARDRYEAAICAGSNLLYRRRAVEAAGGFAKVPLGEDVHSGVKIWVANYRTRYVPLVLCKGIAPEDWPGLTNQQYRWCRSSMMLMISDFFNDAPFSLKQRICFWAAFLYYMASSVFSITSAVPTLVMLWLYPDDVRWTNYVPLIPAFLSAFIVFPRLAKGWDIKIQRVTIANTFCHILAVIDALRDKVQTWVPTGAARNVQRKGLPTPLKVSILLRTWLVVVQILLWTAIVRDIHRHEPWAFVPAIFLGIFQLYMLGPYLYRLDLPHVKYPVNGTPRKIARLRARGSHAASR